MITYIIAKVSASRSVASPSIWLHLSLFQREPQWDWATPAQQNDPVHHWAVRHGPYLQRLGPKTRQADHSAHGRLPYEIHEGHWQYIHRRGLQTLLSHWTGLYCQGNTAAPLRMFLKSSSTDEVTFTFSNKTFLQFILRKSSGNARFGGPSEEQDEHFNQTANMTKKKSNIWALQTNISCTSILVGPDLNLDTCIIVFNPIEV